MRIGLVTWDRLDPSGGNTYNDRLVAGLRAAGDTVVVYRVAGPWPAGDSVSHARLAAVLATEPLTLLDGIVASGAPEVLAETTSRAAVVVHMPIADAPELTDDLRRAYADRERASLHAAAAVVSPSHHAAADLRRRYGLPEVHVAVPGAERAPLAVGSRPPQVLVLGAVTPLKNPLAVLAAATGLDVHLELVGSLEVNLAYAARVIAAAGDRVAVRGVLRGTALAEVWSCTDLLVHAAASETYGLVVSEALAHGVPALVPAGTGAEEALGGFGAGRAYAKGKLAVELARWRTDADRRAAWRRAAQRARERQPGWDDTAARVRQMLARLLLSSRSG